MMCLFCRRLYLVKTDIKSCYDSIDITKLRLILQDILTAVRVVDQSTFASEATYLYSTRDLKKRVQWNKRLSVN